MPDELNWGDANYEQTARTLEPVAEVVVDAAEIATVERVLDVACGTGNAALVAARRGARAVGVDPAEALVGIARERAAASGVEASFVVGDALDLPVADAAFDAVLSVFGVIFAPESDRAAAELLRAARPGGRVVLASWVPSGPISTVGRALFSAVRSPPAAPARWGEADWAEELLTRQGAAAVEVTEHALPFTADSPGVVRRSGGPSPRLALGPAPDRRRAVAGAPGAERGAAERGERGPPCLPDDQPLPRRDRQAVRGLPMAPRC